jgi:tRNA threonylcarbamoyladenosine biosynthesis protein TsaB
MSMPKPILAFDTSLGECSVAVWAKGKLSAHLTEMDRNRQTERLVPMIESALMQAGVSIQKLGLIATTSGPGSFTGIRIGLATARALALATSIPVIAVNTLELVAWQGYEAATVKPATILSLLNAYRGEAYAQAFTYDSKLHPLITPCSLPLEELLPFAGHYAPFLPTGDVEGEFTAHPAARHPDAAALAHYAAAHSLSPEDYRPQAVYIRPPDAKLPTNLLAPSCEAPLG